MTSRRSLATRVSALPGLGHIFDFGHRRHLRVIAFHGIGERALFTQQMQYLSLHFSIVPADQVLGYIQGESALPDHALWLTFDDADPSVFEVGLPVLQEFRVPGTVFVCPGLIQTATPPWWRIVDTAEQHGWTYPAGLSRSLLKTVVDEQRREVIDIAAKYLGDRQPTWSSIDQLDSWISAGMSVGNHTWDHPCLDRCTPTVQLSQITDAHNWLKSYIPNWTPIFAYPNGDRTQSAEDILRTLDYQAVCLFDHQVNPSRPHPLRLSRLRLQAGDSIQRTRAVTSGAHSFLTSFGSNSKVAVP